MRFSIPPWGFVVGGVLLMGMGYSVWDWRAWRQAEYGKYGQGSREEAVIAPAAVLDKWYQNKFVGLRLAYPSSWELTELLKPQPSELKFQPSPTFESVVTLVSDQARLTVAVRASNQSLADEVDALTAVLPPADKPREYINSDRANITILAWTEDGEVIQRAYTKKGEQLFVLTSTTPSASWPNVAKTLWAIVSSLILL